ncbi:MAG TPA: hypothetical protein PLL77_02760 [Pyrinomonadaceae bacterium]|nr:hypothetical protein [Pyrinomonadaceae bacterium]
MKQSFAEFQRKMLEDQEHQRARMDEAFQGFAARFESEHEFDGGFRESVAEHLKLARDEGAKLSATAFAEAEKLDASAAAPTVSFADMRDAIADISSKDSQSAILKTLVEHASAFAPRGAFFIIKNDHIAGWKVFGSEAEGADSAIREIHFPVSSDSILGSAVTSKALTEGSYGANSQDDAFLNPLNFGQPDRMCAIPLVARGRSVAVMYADHGSQGSSVNVEALETLVRVAGLTVEMLAASAAKGDDSSTASGDLENVQSPIHAPIDSYVETPAAISAFEERVEEVPAVVETSTVETDQFSFTDNQQATDAFAVEAPFEAPVAVNPFEQAYEQPAEVQPEPAPEYETNGGAMVFDSGGSIEPAVAEGSPFDRAVEPFEPSAPIGSGGSATMVAEPVVQTATAATPQARLSDRPVDLPIEVPEEERRLHNDARRFARLLVSEIKLYNEKKVLEGRQAHDLYDRLREAIDRSREMYDKRVQPPVAARFDYFHYELLNSLADGDAARFGEGYPGATV